MKKQVISYLIVGIVAFAMGTLSTLKAEEKNAGEQQILAKLDKILANQEDMKSDLAIIKHHT